VVIILVALAVILTTFGAATLTGGLYDMMRSGPTWTQAWQTLCGASSITAACWCFWLARP
jgi:energy-converting hydrogenase Eha subunit G